MYMYTYSVNRLCRVAAVTRGGGGKVGPPNSPYWRKGEISQLPGNTYNKYIGGMYREPSF